MGKENDFALEVVSVRLVRDAPIIGEYVNITSGDEELLGGPGEQKTERREPGMSR